MIVLGMHPEKAAEVAGVGRTKIFIEIREGRLEARKVGRRTIITPDALAKWIELLPKRVATPLEPRDIADRATRDVPRESIADRATLPARDVRKPRAPNKPAGRPTSDMGAK
jgi:hypothetical protein